jgi:hypothetical protein
MLIQQLAVTFCENDERIQRQTLQEMGYLVKTVSTDEALYKKNPEYLSKSLSRNAFATIITNGNAWCAIAELPIDAKLFPNLIAFSLFSFYIFRGSLQPIIVLDSPETVITALKTAVRVLYRQPRRYPEWSGSYKQTNYGWILRKADEEPYALGAWLRFKEFVWPGYTFTTWLEGVDVPKIKFKVIAITDAGVAIRSTIDKKPITIKKLAFYEIAKGWKDYKKGSIPNSALDDKSIYFPYILGLLHWLEQEGRLNDIPEN